MQFLLSAHWMAAVVDIIMLTDSLMTQDAITLFFLK